MKKKAVKINGKLYTLNNSQVEALPDAVFSVSRAVDKGIVVDTSIKGMVGRYGPTIGASAMDIAAILHVNGESLHDSMHARLSSLDRLKLNCLFVQKTMNKKGWKVGQFRKLNSCKNAIDAQRAFGVISPWQSLVSKERLGQLTAHGKQ